MRPSYFCCVVSEIARMQPSPVDPRAPARGVMKREDASVQFVPYGSHIAGGVRRFVLRSLPSAGIGWYQCQNSHRHVLSQILYVFQSYRKALQLVTLGWVGAPRPGPGGRCRCWLPLLLRWLLPPAAAAPCVCVTNWQAPREHGKGGLGGQEAGGRFL